MSKDQQQNLDEIQLFLSMIPGIDVSGLKIEYGGLLGLGKVSKVEGVNFIFHVHYSFFGKFIALDGYACKSRQKYDVERNLMGRMISAYRSI